MASDPFFSGDPPTTVLGMSWAIILGLAAALAALWRKSNKDQDKHAEIQEKRIEDHKEQARDLMESQQIMGKVVDALKRTGPRRDDD